MSDNSSISWLDKLEKYNTLVSKWFAWIGIVFLLVIMLVTGIDVIGGKIFRWRVLGAIDIVTMSQILAITFAVAMSLILGRHVSVEFVVRKFPQGLRRVVRIIVNLIGLALFVLIAWRLAVLGYTLQCTGEATATIYLPLYPFAYAISLSSIPVILVFLIRLIKSILKVTGK